MNNAIIIQARLGSTRLPGKILKQFDDTTILSLITERLTTIKECDLIIATSKSKIDDPLEKFAINNNIKLFRGSEDDVITRFIGAAETYHVDNIIRVCSDNPFLLRQGIEDLISVSKENYYDYVSFKINDKPSILTHYGFYAELVTLSTLLRIQNITNDKKYHEHVTNYIYTHSDEFRIKWLEADNVLEERDDLRMTIDTEEDFINFIKIYSFLKNNQLQPSIQNIISFLDNNTDIIKAMKEQIIKNSK